MNASPLSASPLAPRAKTQARTGRKWIFSLTGVCFVFGGLLAMQMRAIQQVHANQQTEKAGIAEAKLLADKMRAQAATAEKERAKLNNQLVALIRKSKENGSLTVAQVAALGTQIKELQTVAGLTPISGPGVRLVLSDNPNAATTGGDTAFLPGLVHDYDLLQVVNELRSAKADAIAVKGAGGEAIRITGYTPIRCVGPVIYVNWEPVAAPFTVDAVGDPATLKSALSMPNGIVDQLKNNGAIGVKVSALDGLKLPAATGGAPKMRVAKAIP